MNAAMDMHESFASRDRASPGSTRSRAQSRHVGAKLRVGLGTGIPAVKEIGLGPLAGNFGGFQRDESVVGHLDHRSGRDQPMIRVEVDVDGSRSAWPDESGQQLDAEDRRSPGSEPIDQASGVASFGERGKFRDRRLARNEKRRSIRAVGIEDRGREDLALGEIGDCNRRDSWRRYYRFLSGRAGRGTGSQAVRENRSADCESDGPRPAGDALRAAAYAVGLSRTGCRCRTAARVTHGRCIMGSSAPPFPKSHRCHANFHPRTIPHPRTNFRTGEVIDTESSYPTRCRSPRAASAKANVRQVLARIGGSVPSAAAPRHPRARMGALVRTISPPISPRRVVC